MTAKQREVLAAMRPGKDPQAAAAIAQAGGINFNGVLRLLYRLEESGYVLHRGSGWILTPSGDAVARRARAMRADVPAPRPEPPKRIERVGFMEGFRRDPERARHGRLFMVVRVLRCWLDLAGYRGKGHPRCGPGVQGGHTAHHLGRLDEEGMIPGCGLAHDLYAGLGGHETQQEFKGWLRAGGITLADVGQAYVNDARVIVERGDYGDEALAP